MPGSLSGVFLFQLFQYTSTRLGASPGGAPTSVVFAPAEAAHAHAAQGGVL